MLKRSSHKRVAKDDQADLSLLQRFGLFFYDHRELTVLYVVTLLVLGVMSYVVWMQRQGFPGVDVPVSVISGTYFVNDREKVDTDVTKPISEAIGRLPEVDKVISQAGDNFFVLTVRYDEGVPSQTGNDLVQREIERQKILPASAQAEFKPINATKFAEEYDIHVLRCQY